MSVLAWRRVANLDFGESDDCGRDRRVPDSAEQRRAQCAGKPNALRIFGHDEEHEILRRVLPCNITVDPAVIGRDVPDPALEHGSGRPVTRIGAGVQTRFNNPSRRQDAAFADRPPRS